MDSHLLRFNIQSQKYVVFDFETESLNLVAKNRPWQASFIVCQGKQILEKHDLFPFWDDLKVSADAARITRFNYDTYKQKSCDKKLALEKLNQYIYDPAYLLVGHNILGFDVYVHAIWMRELGLKEDYSYAERCIDTNCLAKGFRLNEKPGENRIAWQYRMNDFFKKGVKSSLGTMCKEFGIDYDPQMAHDGIYDITVNQKVFLELIHRIEF